jgi:mRNA interferase RelE/StbE
MHKLIFDEEAIKFLDKLPKDISKRIFKKIQDTKENPHHYFIKLTNRQEYKLRVGDYRVIADINDSEIIIYIITIGHRSNIYKKI